MGGSVPLREVVERRSANFMGARDMLRKSSIFDPFFLVLHVKTY